MLDAFVSQVLERTQPLISDQFLEAVSPFEDIVVMAHNNPDPDAIASGWAVRHLIEKRLSRAARLISAGDIIRAENRKMVSLLHPPLSLNAPMPHSSKSLIILVDCDVHTTNHPKIDASLQPVAVIDHHCALGQLESRAVFADRRAQIAATSSIAASYLYEQDIDPTPDLATALVYGIRTETKAGEFHYSALDRFMLTWLVGRADPCHLAQIEDAPLSPPYFSDLVLALQSTFLYGDAAFCILPQSQGPEVVGEVADLLVRCDSVKKVLCGTISRGHFVLSVRMACGESSAAMVVKRVLDGIGHGGGHDHRAGGIIENVSPQTAPRLYRELRRRWLEACNASGTKGVRLVSKAHIMKNL